MSRSYRKPFASVCGNRSAKEDKVLAHRGVRRAQNHITRLLARNPELDLEMPHFRECSCNNVYGWGRDGHQRWQYPSARHWSRHMMTVQRLYKYRFQMRPGYMDPLLKWPPEWFVRCMRK